MGKCPGYVIPPRYWAWAGRRRTVRVVLWVIAVGVGVSHFDTAGRWMANDLDTPEPFRRPTDRGYGHTQIDFGGQWVMGRMLVEGHGRDLYHRQAQWGVVRAGYPEADETPVQREESILPGGRRRLARTPDDVGHDADNLMQWFMGTDPPEWKTGGGAVAAQLAVEPLGGNPFAAAARHQAARDAITPSTLAKLEEPAVGGPLYPPVHAFIYAPVGLIDRPHVAYRVFQLLAVGLAYVGGLGISVLTRGRVWWSVGSVALLLYPGCRSGLELGQNPTLSFAILVWGWVLASRGRDWTGGMVWGLFAFKPVWGMAFFLVPLLMGRWRFCVGMVGTGFALAVLTLPVVGLHSWFDWLAVGSEAADQYTWSQNWINLSRDLQGIPRRFLHDFGKPYTERETPLAKTVAWTLWGLVFATTVVVYRLRADRRDPCGLGAGFLFLGAFLTCYRFMYYDVVLSLMGGAVLFADPRRLFRTRVFGLSLSPGVPAGDRELVAPPTAPDPFGPKLVGYVNSFPLTVVLGLYLIDNWLMALAVEATIGVGGWGHPEASTGGGTAWHIPRVEAAASLAYPWDTFLVILLWAWCGVRLIGWREAAERTAGR